MYEYDDQLFDLSNLEANGKSCASRYSFQLYYSEHFIAEFEFMYSFSAVEQR